MKVFATLAVALVAFVAVSPAAAAVDGALGFAPRRHGADPFTFRDVFAEDARRLHETTDPAADAGKAFTFDGVFPANARQLHEKTEEATEASEPKKAFTFDGVFPANARRLHDTTESEHTTEDEVAADAETVPEVAPLIDAVSYTTAPPSGSQASAELDAGEEDKEVTEANDSTRRRNLRAL